MRSCVASIFSTRRFFQPPTRTYDVTLRSRMCISSTVTLNCNGPVIRQCSGAAGRPCASVWCPTWCGYADLSPQTSHPSSTPAGLYFPERPTGQRTGSSSSSLNLILPRSRTGTVWFYTYTSNKRAARPKLCTKSLTRDLKRMYSRFTLVRISIKL